MPMVLPTYLSNGLADHYRRPSKDRSIYCGCFGSTCSPDSWYSSFMAEVSSNQRIFATFLTCARATWAIYKQRCSHMNRHECICIYRYMYLKTAALQFFARSNESHFHSFSLPLSELVSTFLSLFLFSSISLSLYV